MEGRGDVPRHLVERMLRNAKGRAARDGRTFAIVADDIISVWPQDGLCAALGMPLVASRWRGGEPDSPTLDRIDALRGYEVGNIAVISNLANRVKCTATADDLERIAAWMRRVQPGSMGHA